MINLFKRTAKTYMVRMAIHSVHHDDFTHSFSIPVKAFSKKQARRFAADNYSLKVAGAVEVKRVRNDKTPTNKATKP